MKLKKLQNTKAKECPEKIRLFKFSKKVRTKVIIISIIIIILIGIGLSQVLKNTNKNLNQGSNTMSNYSNVYHSYVFPNTNNSPQNSGTQTPSPQITIEMLQEILKKSPEMNKLSSDAKIILQFHNDQKLFTGYIFFVSSQGQVSSYNGQAYDFRITININTISRLQNSANVCSEIKSIISEGNAWIIEQPSNPFIIIKYMPIKGCVM